ncbi:hypothetical protein QTP88_022527 [Uroleucon formosanum]
MVKNKIDSIRGCFCKELKKIKDSQRSGAREEDVYVPHLWYFKNLMFLKDQETPRNGISSIDFTDDTVSSEPFFKEKFLVEPQEKFNVNLHLPGFYEA